jgi:hypothetical protein
MANTANFVSREDKEFARNIGEPIKGDIWIEWTSSLGTFTIHRNDGHPIFPMTPEEAAWVRVQVREIFSMPF